MKKGKNKSRTKTTQYDSLLELMESPFQMSFLLLIFILVFGIVGFMQKDINLMTPLSSSFFKQDVSVTVDPGRRLIISYQSGVSSVLKNYFEERNNNNWDIIEPLLDYQKSQNWFDKIQETKSKVLDLTVPAEYKELHLNLVLALTWEEEAVQDLLEASSYTLNSDKQKNLIKLAQEKLKTAEDYYQEIFEDYDWL